MSLGATDISVSAIMTETGLSSGNVSALVGASNLNKYSFYAPGSLSVDANYDVVLTPPASNYKLGDFRLYNHSALTPGAQSNYTQNWGPGASDFDFAVSWFPQNMNIKCFAVPGDYVTMDFYPTATDRTNQTNRIKRQITAITFNSITPLTGHTRQPYYQASSTQAPVWIYGYPYAGLSDPNTTIYMETYISDLTGNRKINLGTRSNNYTIVTFHKNQIPYITKSGNITPVPSGYTSAWIEITSGLTLCDTSGNLSQTFGGSTFGFYARIRSVYGANYRIIEQTACTVTLTLRGESQTVYSSPLNYNGSATYISGTLSNGKTWAYDDAATITATATFPTTPNYTTC